MSDDQDEEDDDEEELFVEREADEDGRLLPDHAPRRDHQRRLIDVVADWLAENRSYSEVVDLAVEATGCSPSTAKRAIVKARERWAVLAVVDPVADRRRFLSRLDMDWRGASAAGDFRASSQIARTYADVAGFRATVKIEHSGTVGLRPVAALSPDERRAEIAALQAKQLAAGGVPMDETPAQPVAAPAKKKRGS